LKSPWRTLILIMCQINWVLTMIWYDYDIWYDTIMILYMIWYETIWYI
jgi:hypothetical protein